MRPKLQRLLSRLGSLDLLRSLVGGRAGAEHGTPTKEWGCRCVGGGPSLARRRYASAAVGVREEEDLPFCGALDQMGTIRNSTPKTNNASTKLAIFREPPALSAIPAHPPGKTVPRSLYGQWDERHWTHEQLEFESSLHMGTPDGRTRLLDSEPHMYDMRLWGVLLEYRKRIHGADGILTFWDAIIKRGILIPTTGMVADKFWLSFLDLGFRTPLILERICQYADHIWATQKRRWSKLYVHVVRFFLLNGNSRDAIAWHKRLFEYHSPGPAYFAEMCRHVVFQNGDTVALRTIYMKSTHRNVYSKIVPLLCQREDFKGALDWHFFLLNQRDLPGSSKIVEPLIHFLAIYEPKAAARVTRSLVAAGVSFASTISKELVDNTKISREMMNLIHGETFGVSVKKYNDNLGARWFATHWIPLDIAINTVHALGVQEIGPLSLQAIALRDPDPRSVNLRISQLRGLGVSIGNSLYSRAIEKFARMFNSEYLEGLINSDQHPDTLEDAKLQEELLLSFARNGDWTQYRRTWNIRALASRSPGIEKWNLELRSLISLGNREAVEETLYQMRLEKVPVKSRTIAHLLRHTLLPRRRGHRAINIQGRTNRGRHNDLNTSIRLLKGIMESGSYVPIVHWREIIRRLGMLGRFNDLQSLVLFLTSWYGPPRSSPLLKPRRYNIPTQVPTTHPLHPLKLLFDVHFQGAVVEWGFISSLQRKPSFSHDPRRNLVPLQDASLPKVTSGITLLRLLGRHGVHINGPSVRKALLNRLVTYYGPGKSIKKYNRLGSQRMWGKLSMVAKQIDDALGGTYFSGVNLPQLIEAVAARKLKRIEKRRQRHMRHPSVGKSSQQLPRPGTNQTWYGEVF